jgi:hypothetical protein
MFSPYVSHLRAAGKSVGFSECIQEAKIMALSQKQLGLQLDTSQLRDEALKLVQKKNRRIIYDEKGVEIDSSQGNILVNH